MENIGNRDIKIYDIILEIDINKAQSDEYKETVANLANDYKNTFLEENKDALLSELLNYKSKMEKSEKVNLTFYSEAYDHENTLNGKIINLQTAKELSSFMKEGLAEKVVINKEEIVLKIDGIGIFKAPNSSNINDGVYDLKVSNVKIEEKDEKLRVISIIGDSRREIVEDLLRNLKEENKLFSSEQYKCFLKRPENPVNKTFYKGVNRLRLGYASAKKGYKDSRWISFKQAQENKWKIKKGEKGTLCEKWTFNKKVVEKDRNGKVVEYEVKLDKPYSNYFLLFNAEQVEGMPKLKEEPSKSLEKVTQDLIASSQCKIEKTDDLTAYYEPRFNTIKIPNEIFFLNKEDYIETLLHEMCHSTGAEVMTSRHEINDNLLKEELTTEIATLFLKSNLGLEFEGKHIDDHSSFAKYFTTILETDYHDFFRICSEADKAADMVYSSYQELNEKKNEIVPIKMPFENLNVIFHSSDYNFGLEPGTRLNGIKAYNLLEKALEIDNKSQEVYKTSISVGYEEKFHKLQLTLGKLEFGMEEKVAEGLEYRFRYYKDKMKEYIAKENRPEILERLNSQVEIDNNILDNMKKDEKQYVLYKRKVNERKRTRNRNNSKSR